VIHLAAYSLVGESVSEPAKYYRNNVEKGTVLLDEMVRNHVNRIVFSSTAAVYGEPAKQPIVETDPQKPTNPYGETKLAFEELLQNYGKSSGLQHVSLRYFNAAGASKTNGELHDPETHLIPIALQAAAGKRDSVEIYGDDYPTPDGTCIRDYIHVVDLARAHILALKAESPSPVYNLGCGGAGYSVKEVIRSAEEVTGRRIETKFAPRRNGDPPILIASSELIRQELGWNPVHQDLGEMIGSAWIWMQAKTSGNVPDGTHAHGSAI
jgi:UDP-glucose 4-epimerase